MKDKSRWIDWKELKLMHEYVPLHIHTDYDFGESLVPIVELVKKAKDMGYQALAITGRNVMHGALLFETRCREQGIKPIIGCEVALTWKNDLDHFRLILLAETQEGYQNLIQLSSYLHQPEFVQGLTLAKLEEHKAGLIAIIPAAIIKRDGRFHAKLAELFAADNLFHEYLPRENGASRQDFHYGQPVCNRAVRYLNQQSEAVFRKICTGFLDDEISKVYLPTRDEIETWQQLCPDAVANSWRIAERCNATAALRFTEADWPEARNAEADVAALRTACLQEIARLYPSQQDIAVACLEAELKIIKEQGLQHYLLILADVGAFIRRQGILVYPDRATDSSSIFYYLLGLSPVDPIRFKLTPDFSLASPRNRQQSIILRTGFEGQMRLNRYLQQKYAERLGISMVAYRRQERNALLKAAETIKFDRQQTEKIIKKISYFPPGLDELPPLLEVWNEAHPMNSFVNSSRKIRKLFTVAASLYLTCYGGAYLTDYLMLGPRNLRELLPLDRKSHRKQLTVQYISRSARELGFLTIGIWENKESTAVEETLLILRANGKPVPNVRDIPLDDEFILAKAELDHRETGVTMADAVNAAVGKAWLDWFEQHCPDEFELARQRTREIHFRSKDTL